ncbi:MAG: class I SAM-dependent methyltransferase [Chitinophagaceae bacterium]|nr:class I SAM-dependent methyltransferase [Chitinophagaceae bacterium]
MGNVNDTFFDGSYKDVWRSMIPDELTTKETAYIISRFSLLSGSLVLDLMCGYGRHTLALSRQGIQVTAVDNLSAYTNEIAGIVKQENLPVEVHCMSVLDFKPAHSFDAAICMGNNLNFFDRADNIQILSSVARSLKPGGFVFINTWSLAEIVWKNHREKSWSQEGDYKYIADSRVLFNPTRIESETTLIAPDGNQEHKSAVDYIFSLNEMEDILRESGLIMEEVYSVPGRKKFTIGDPRAYIIAVKA